MKFDYVAYLEACHTKELLGLLQKTRKCEGFYSPFDNSEGVTTNQVKHELSFREHVPNKKEARKIRQEKARKTH